MAVKEKCHKRVLMNVSYEYETFYCLLTIPVQTAVHFIACLQFPFRLQYIFSELPAMTLQQISKYSLRFISELLRAYSSWEEKKYLSKNW